MKKIQPLYVIVTTIAFLFILSGCVSEGGFKRVDLDLDSDPNKVSEEDSVIDELTPIISIGDDVSVGVYKCTTSTDCNRCQGGDVYGQACISETCQGSLDLIEVCKDQCSAGQCIEDDVLTGEEFNGSIGEDYDLNPKKSDDEMIIDNDDLLPEPDGTQCTNKIENCVGYRGAGSAYLTNYPACECKLIYVPAGCSPLDPPCPDFSAKSNYPDCACK